MKQDVATHFARWLPVGLLTVFLSGTAAAQPIGGPTVWGLQRDNRFSVETVVERTTSLQLDDAEPSIATTIDTMKIDYDVDNVMAGGEIAVKVQVSRISRENNRASDPKSDAVIGDSRLARQLNLLRGLSVVAVVDRDGVIIGLPGYREALEKMANADPASRQIISNSVSQRVFESWIDQPFWMTAPESDFKKGDSWDRLHEVSLGPLGILHTVATCEVASVEDNIANLTITGNSRHVPPATNRPPGAESSPVFRDLNAKVNSFTGTAKLHLGDRNDVADEKAADENEDADKDDVPRFFEDPESEQNVARPPFESLNLTIVCEGDAGISIGGQTRPLRFEQTQTHTSRLLPGYRIGRQRRRPMLIMPTPR